MQEQQLTPSDFYAIWVELKLNLKNDGSELAFSILCGMNMREEQKHIIDSRPILAAVFMDPRYKILLNTNQKFEAQRHLTQLWQRIRKFDASSSPFVAAAVTASHGESVQASASGMAAAESENEGKQGKRHINLLEQLLTSKKGQNLRINVC